MSSKNNLEKDYDNFTHDIENMVEKIAVIMTGYHPSLRSSRFCGTHLPRMNKKSVGLGNYGQRTKHQSPSTEHQAPSTEHQSPSTEHQALSTYNSWYVLHTLNICIGLLLFRWPSHFFGLSAGSGGRRGKNFLLRGCLSGLPRIQVARNVWQNRCLWLRQFHSSSWA